MVDAQEPELKFTDFLSAEKWKPFDDHLRTFNEELSADLALVAEANARIAVELRSQLEQTYDVKRVDETRWEWAREQLFSGQVSAVDGTYAVYPLLSGLRCRIGVAATSYQNKRTEAVFYVSEQQVSPPEADPLALLAQRKTENLGLTTMAVRAIMAYMERQKALERPEEWKLLNGALVPYELRTGLGRLRALEPCLELARRLIDAETVVGVVGTSSHYELVSVGLALRPNEYVRVYSLEADLQDYLRNAHFNPSDERLFGRFIESHGKLIDAGIYRAGARAYVFHAHRARFDEAAALLMVDSSFQPIRSYPLLVDYADSVCTRMLAGTDFERQVEAKLARHGQLGFEMGERGLRRR